MLRKKLTKKSEALVIAYIKEIISDMEIEKLIKVIAGISLPSLGEFCLLGAPFTSEGIPLAIAKKITKNWSSRD